MLAQEIFGECERAGLTLRADGANIRVKPASNLTDDLQAILRKHKQELIEALKDRHDAREERAAIPEYDHGFTCRHATAEADRRVNFVTCDSCMHWDGQSPCGAGMVTSGDPIADVRARLCGFHTPGRKQ